MNSKKIMNATLAVQFEAAFRNAYAGNAHKFFQLSPTALSMLKNAKEEDWKHCQYFLRGCIKTRANKGIVQLVFNQELYEENNKFFFTGELSLVYTENETRVLILPKTTGLITILNPADSEFRKKGHYVQLEASHFGDFVKITMNPVDKETEKAMLDFFS